MLEVCDNKVQEFKQRVPVPTNDSCVKHHGGSKRIVQQGGWLVEAAINTLHQPGHGLHGLEELHVPANKQHTLAKPLHRREWVVLEANIW